MDQPSKIADPARGQLNRENDFSLSSSSSSAPENLSSRDWFDWSSRPPASACSFSTLRRNLVLAHGIPPDFRGGAFI